jgi:prevent-host-death family protein
VIRADAIHSLTDFQRNAKAVIERVRTQHQPVVITVNGEAAVVIQDAGDYQRMEDERQAVLAAIAEGEADIAAGRTVSAEDAREFFRNRYRNAG